MIAVNGAWAAVDVGGTTLGIGGCRADGAMVAAASIAAHAAADRATVVGALARAAAVALDLTSATRLVVAVPGPFDHAAGVSAMTHKFGAIRDVELRPALRARLEPPPDPIVFVDDAEAMAVGAVERSGRTTERVLVVAFGTGFGSALVADGAPVPRVGDHIVGRLWDRRLPDGTPLDDLLSARGLADALAVAPADLRRTLASIDADATASERLATWSGRASGALRQVAADVGADSIVVGGGAAPVLDLVGPAWAEAIGVPVERTEGDGHALLGAVRLAQAASDATG